MRSRTKSVRRSVGSTRNDHWDGVRSGGRRSGRYEHVAFFSGKGQKLQKLTVQEKKVGKKADST